MNPAARLIIHVLLFVLGIVLLIGGIIADKHGATVIGVIVSAVNIQQYLSKRKAGTSQ